MPVELYLDETGRHDPAGQFPRAEVAGVVQY